MVLAESTGEYLVPDVEELGCVSYGMVYNCETSSLDSCDYEEKEEEEGMCVPCQRSPRCRLFLPFLISFYEPIRSGTSLPSVF